MKDTTELLSAYADGELDEAGIRTAEARLLEAPGAQAVLDRHRDVTALLRAAFSERHFEDDTGTLAQRIRSHSGPRRRLVPRSAWAVAASILLVAAGYGAGVAWPRLVVSDREQILTAIAAYHDVYSRETIHLVEVPASQADHLKAWLGKRVNRDLAIPNLTGSGLTFAGGRLLALAGAPVAELVYTRANAQPIAVCVLKIGGPAQAIHLDRRRDMNLASWDDGKHTYVVLGDADPETIRALASKVQTQL